MTIPGKHGVNFYICLGEDTENDPYDFAKVRFPAVFTNFAATLARQPLAASLAPRLN